MSAQHTQGSRQAPAGVAGQPAVASNDPFIATLTQGLTLALESKRSATSAVTSLWSLFLAELSLSKTAAILTVWLSLLVSGMLLLTWLLALAGTALVLFKASIPLIHIAIILISVQIVACAAVIYACTHVSQAIGIPKTKKLFATLAQE